MSCGPSRLCSPQPWFHSQALGVAGQLSAEPDPHTLRVLSPRSPSKNLCAEQLRQIQTLPTDNFKPCTVHRGLTGWVPAQLSFLDGFQHF